MIISENGPDFAECRWFCVSLCMNCKPDLKDIFALRTVILVQASIESSMGEPVRNANWLRYSDAIRGQHYSPSLVSDRYC